MNFEAFSVLLPIYNRIDLRDTFPKSISAIFENTVLPSQVVVICDGPLDWDIEDATASYKDAAEITIVRLPNNVGLARALNIGLKHCKFELIARVDADDFCTSDRFEEQLRYFRKGYTLIGSNIQEIDESGAITTVKVVPEMAPEIRSFAIRRNPFNHMTVMYKKSHVLAVGGYPHFYLKEDYALWVRLLATPDTVPINIQKNLMLVTAGNSMYARRSSAKIMREELKMQRFLMRFLQKPFYKVLIDLFIRVSFYFLPLSVKKKLYNVFLRQ